jgi:monofunctional glycosyltransferase
MLARWMEQETAERNYVPLWRVSENLRNAVIVSEDTRFCQHHGVDWGALRYVIDHPGAAGPKRGASTIPMQTAKNLFLWPSRSYLRKVIEIPLALLIDLEWPKKRTLEVYLNLAQWGDGVFGAEAAARHYFHKAQKSSTRKRRHCWQRPCQVPGIATPPGQPCAMPGSPPASWRGSGGLGQLPTA